MNHKKGINGAENATINNYDTPMRNDAFEKDNITKIKNIEHYFKGIMHELGLDLENESLQGTPYRVAKMYANEMFMGLDPKNKPDVTVFDNEYNYNKMLIEKDITFYSACEHHFLPMVGKAHVGYIASEKVIGLSKINRLVNYYARRPQVQERLTLQIFNELTHLLGHKNIIVITDAEHLCVSSRGVSDKTSITTCIEYGGEFDQTTTRKEFLSLLS